MKAPYIIVKHFLDDSACDAIRKYGAENMLRLASGNDINPYFNNTTIHIDTVDDSSIQPVMLLNVKRTMKLIETFYSTPTRQYLDHTNISVWATGAELSAHADNMFWDREEKNYVPHRTYSAVLYLNDDFSGGEFCWNDIVDKRPIVVDTIKPEKGMLIAFGAGREYVHSVPRVKDGTRWTQPIWLTNDVTKVSSVYQTERYTNL